MSSLKRKLFIEEEVHEQEIKKIKLDFEEDINSLKHNFNEKISKIENESCKIINKLEDENIEKDQTIIDLYSEIAFYHDFFGKAFEIAHRLYEQEKLFEVVNESINNFQELAPQEILESENEEP
ncbi:hypothetical protein C2G38_2050427 [Gigaspora rosea]|uniref:Uncharacterized protein n=1 Tax=Gigaspora rosea TaxID=44941 RepID=A0A397TYD5_9GLOM|nr:hypothetical protein C2G38_2050427 [Gigaspora rosea]